MFFERKLSRKDVKQTNYFAVYGQKNNPKMPSQKS